MKPALSHAILLCVLLTACSPVESIHPVAQIPSVATSTESTIPLAPSPEVSPTANAPSIEPTLAPPGATSTINSAEPAEPSATPLPSQPPVSWRDLPVIPVPGDRVREIYLKGLELGNNPNAFSKIGDCGSTPAWFLGDFDRGPRYYRLGEYTDLQPVIDHFQGSFDRTSLAAKSGFNASSVFSPLWSNREFCLPEETPLACEYRVHQPSYAFILLGSNDVWHLDTFEDQMRKIIEYSLDRGVIPILSTKADNLEKDWSINQTIARLAQEYQVPLINYWLAVQPLPDQGLQDDSVHITWGPNRFDDARAMRAGWPVRNLTSLQALDAVWRAATGQIGSQTTETTSTELP